MSKEKARLFGKKYTLKELYEIEKNNDDPDIEFLGEDLDCICDCMTVDFFEEHCLSFRWRKTGYFADVFVRRYEDGDEEMVSVYHHKAKKKWNPRL
jgi:hypothetical protein